MISWKFFPRKIDNENKSCNCCFWCTVHFEVTSLTFVILSLIHTSSRNRTNKERGVSNKQTLLRNFGEIGSLCEKNNWRPTKKMRF